MTGSRGPSGLGFDLGSFDPNHQFYRVRVMSIISTYLTTQLQVPYTDFVNTNVYASSPPIWQIQMVGVPPGDPLPLRYYTTMTVVQGAPGLQTVRSRIFIPPQVNPTQPYFISANDPVAGAPATFTVDGITEPNGSQLPPATYSHVVINNPNDDPTGPRHVFLQQPA